MRTQSSDPLARWRAVLEQIGAFPYPVLLKDAQLRWVYASPVALDLFGLTGVAYHGHTSTELLSSDPEGLIAVSDSAALVADCMSESLHHIGARSFHFFDFPLRAGSEIIGLLTIAPEISDLEQAQMEAERLRDFYAALAGIGQLIAHHPDPETLFREASRILETHVGVLLPVIVSVDGENGRIRSTFDNSPTGLEKLYQLDISLDPGDPTGNTPFARAIREGTTIVSRDAFHDPAVAFLRSEYERLGIRAVAAIPIRRFDEVVAALGVRARDPAFFSPALLRLLEQGALSIGLGLEAHERQRQLERQALYDPLTALPNRRLFTKRIAQACEQTKDHSPLLGVGILDLDGFKQVNDRLGHGVGDRLLQQVAARLLETIRTSDLVSRLGGDEFGLLCPELTGPDDLQADCLRILEALHTPFVINGEPVQISTSIGFTLYPLDDEDPETLLRHADLALYAAKDNGRDQCQLYRPALDADVAKAAAELDLVTQALREDRLVLHYQPIISIDGREDLNGVVGVEALLRIRDDQRSLLSPESFWAALDNVTLARPVGRFVLEAAVAQGEAWHRQGLPLRVSLNVSARHFLDPRFPNDLAQALQAHPALPPAHVAIEITETAPLQNLCRAQEAIAHCARLGVQVSLDDFGTGNASLRHLQQLAVNNIKIDLSFVRNMLSDPKDLAIVAAITMTENLLGLQTVAEGVETVYSGAVLADLGCSHLQGYVISRPMPAAEIPPWVAGWKAPPEWNWWARQFHRQFSMGLPQMAAMHHFRLREVLETAPAVPDPETVLSPDAHHRCPLGRWYDSQREHLSGLSAFRRVGELHEEMHRKALEIVSAQRPFTAAEKETLWQLNDSLFHSLLIELPNEKQQPGVSV